MPSAPHLPDLPDEPRVFPEAPVGEWVRRQDPDAIHRCITPDVTLQGDLWRCCCGRLWRVGRACDWCDRSGLHAHGGTHIVGMRWRPGTWWQQVKHRRGERP